MKKEEIKVCDQTFALWMEIANSVDPTKKPAWAKKWNCGCPACEYHCGSNSVHCKPLICILSPIWGILKLEYPPVGDALFGSYACEKSLSSPYRKWKDCSSCKRKRYYALKIAWGAYQLGHDPNDW